jgi:hypothetical protein
VSDLRRSIATRYKGILFRSKLEADWARAFDALGVEWQYEVEGRYFGDVFYLPDFYLPRSHQYVEVKGEWTPPDVRKADAMVRHLEPRAHVGQYGDTDVVLVAANPGGDFYGFSRILDYEDFTDFLLTHSHRLKLAQCDECAGWWFFDEEAGWQCHCCGSRAGFRQLLDSPLVGWPNVRPQVAA